MFTLVDCSACTSFAFLFHCLNIEDDSKRTVDEEYDVIFLI